MYSGVTVATVVVCEIQLRVPCQSHFKRLRIFVNANIL